MNSATLKWIIKRIVKEAFIISFALWCILFVLELVKPGIVSNYLSLANGLFYLFLFGILTLLLEPTITQLGPKAFGKKDLFWRVICSVLLVITLLLILNASVLLTLFIIFVTLLAFWLGTSKMNS